MRNIEPSTTEAELMNLFQSFGTVRKVASNLILSRHMAFVTFYDLRHAEVRFGFAPFFFFFFFFLSLFSCALSHAASGGSGVRRQGETRAECSVAASLSSHPH